MYISVLRVWSAHVPQNASKKVGAKPPTCLDALKASRGRPDAPNTDDFPNARNISNCRKKSRGAAKYHSTIEAVYCLVGAMSGYWAMSRGVGNRRLRVFGRPRAAGNPCQKTGCVAIRLKESFPGTRAAQIPKVYDFRSFKISPARGAPSGRDRPEPAPEGCTSGVCWGRR